MASSRCLDAFDQWCLRRMVHIPYTAHITNEEVRRRTCQPPVTSVIAKRRLHLFGHLAYFSKLLEKVMHKRLYSYLQSNNILYRYQFGFRKKS